MELRKKSVFAKKLEENRKNKLKFSQQNVKHPLCEENLLKSQELVKCVLNHPSMPKSRYLPNVGTVCNKIDEQCGVFIQNRLELRNIAIFHKPKLQHVKGGTSLSHLTETYTGMKIPVEKSIG